MTVEITRLQFFDVWIAKNKDERFEAVFEFFKGSYNIFEPSEDLSNEIKVLLRNLCKRFSDKWAASGRHRQRFLNKNLTWLSDNINLPYNILREIPSSSHSQPGRPSKSFELCCEKTKKRKVQNLLVSTSSEEISIANELQLRQAGKRDSAAIVRELSFGSPKRGTAIKKARKISSGMVPLSADEALSMIIDANLSTHQYNIIRQRINKSAKGLLPPYYDKISDIKKECYPDQKTVTESYAECDLQALVNHTITRLCLAHHEVLRSMEKTESSATELSLLIKWGCDGAQQKQYKQKFDTSIDHFDENLFSTSMVPIKLTCLNQEQEIVVWQNPSPSSTRYCRPIKLNFTKETTALIKDEVNLIQQQIDSLSPVEIHVQDYHVIVKAKFMLTMIDGKICSALSSVSSSQSCYICGAKPSEMNKPSLLKPLDPTSLTFGLSPLHSWIRFMECILHIAYRLDIKVWQARGQDNKDKVKARKQQIQKKFREEMGLLVDMPNQQSGNTNDGNTARRFFRNEVLTAEITGINVHLIHRFHIILETMGCGFSINLNAFEEYAKGTRDLFISEYSWYNMPVSVHKVLFHGREVMASHVLPIGQLSEEAQEARNKDNRRYREFFTRKTSRVDCNTDLLNRLLVSSDPYLASLRYAPKKSRSAIEPEVLALLAIPKNV